MIFLCLDLATTGLFKDGQEPPKIVGVAAALYEDETIIESILLLVRPDGWDVPEEAEKVHGISQKMAARFGVPLRVALAALTNLANAAPTVVSYGFESYDAQVIRAALAQYPNPPSFPRTGALGECVREMCTPICGTPDGTGYKWPSLQTACLNILNRPLRETSIVAQMRATADLYRALKQKGL